MASGSSKHPSKHHRPSLQKKSEEEKFFQNTWQPFLQEAQKTENALKDVIEKLGNLKTDLDEELKMLASVPTAVSQQSMSKPNVIRRLRKVLETRREEADKTLTALVSIDNRTRLAKETVGGQVRVAQRDLDTYSEDEY